DQRYAPGALDRLRHGPARAEVVDDLRAGLFLEQRRGQKGGDEIAGYELARVVDEEAAVGVAVERSAEVGVLLQRLRHDELAVLGQQRVRLVVRKRSVGLEEATNGVDRQSFQHAWQHHTGHAVRGVDHHPQRLDRLDLDEREHPLDPGGPDVVWLANSSCGARPPHVVADGDPTRLELFDEGTHDRVGALLVQFRGVDPADVVRLEDLRIEHGPDANETTRTVVFGLKPGFSGTFDGRAVVHRL